MKYWSDMRRKSGFDDGNAEPAGCDLYRYVYIQAVNTLAEQFGSNVRAVAHDSMGSHNRCMILLRWVGQAEEVEPDDGMKSAIVAALERGLDDFVVTRVSIDLQFHEVLGKL